jgi:AcrR family transcriptional regulator
VKEKPRPKPSAGPHPDESSESSTHERIVRAAYDCFEHLGIRKTRIEDVAEKAGVSRPTVYKYFAGKTDLVDHICSIESTKVNTEVRRRLVRHQPFENLVTEALLLVIRIASENPYVRRILEYHQFQSVAAATTSTVHRMHRNWWGRLLDHAADRGELASDIDMDEILTWITLTQGMLLVYVDGGNVDDATLRRLIRRFVVDPLLAKGTRSAMPAAADSRSS